MSEAGVFDIDAEKGFLLLEDEDGNQERFMLEDDVTVEGNRYLILCHEDEVELGEYVALRVVVDEETGKEHLEIIEEDEEIEKLQQFLEQRDNEA